MFTSDDSSSKANCDGEDNRRVNVEMDETKNNVDCDDECRKYDPVEKIIIICDDSEGEPVNPGDLIMEIEIYAHNETSNNKDTVMSSSGRKAMKCISGTEKQNVDPAAVKVDIEYESGYKCLEIDKNEDVKEEVNVDITSELVLSNGKYHEQVYNQNVEFKAEDEGFLMSYFKVKHDAKAEEVKEEANMEDTSDLVGFNSQHDERITVKLNGVWDEAACDSKQEEYNVTEFIKCGNDIKKEKIDSEDVLIDNEKCAQDGIISRENLKSTYVPCENNPQSSSNIRWYCCKFCEYKTEFVNSFKKHLESEHKEGPLWYHCYHCEYKTVYKRYLKRHFRLRHDDSVESYKCQHCDFETKDKDYFKKHFKFKHDDSAEWYKCQHCEFKTKNKGALREHLKSKHDNSSLWYKCQLCNLKTRSRANLMRHYKIQHDQVNELHHCQHCAFKTKHKGSLQEHLEFKHNVVSERGKLHCCQFCDYRSKYKKILKLHLKTKHSENVEWLYCRNCEFKSKDERCVRIHIKNKHDANAKWYECCFCDFKTKHKSNLMRHFKIQHDQGSKWHHCQCCALKTKHKESLEAHLELIHNIISGKGKLHQCQFCDYRCKYKRILKNHLKTKHSENVEL